MEPSIRVPPTTTKVLKASGTATGPGTKNCLGQISKVHRLQDSEFNYADHQNNLNMIMLRNRSGLGGPIRMAMELHSARHIGRLPFLQSSHLMEDVLLGKLETCEFGDFLGVPENMEVIRNPHSVMEKSLKLF